MAQNALPSGTVTFLFTDLVDSTPLWEVQRDAMREAIAEHDRLVRVTVEEHGGVLVKFGGDGAMAAFDSAPDAATVAVALQHAIATHTWAVPLAMRVGLHTGSASPDGRDYHGPAVNRAARIAGAAHGGQILLSTATAALLDGYATLDLGEHELKGLPPQHIHQLLADDLPARFPPLASGIGPAGAPPRSATSFVGRGDDLDQVASLVSTHRLVTLTGAGGSGKTRLAIEVLARSPERVAFADLAPAHADVEVVVTLANALGLSGGVTDDLTTRVCEYLAAHPILCALDNCEHVLDVVADIAEEVLRRPGDSHLLLTSREPVGVVGEQVCAVGPLPVSTDAVQLFVDRAREARPDFELDDTSRDAVHEICRRLDGLPLAIELAAARIAHLSAGELLDRLDDRFRILTGSRRRVPRHQTLATTLDWSHDLLGADEQAMLRRLSAFPASFTLQGTEALAGVDDPVAVLGSLVAKSLVQGLPQPDGTMRYRLLETVRMYAGERLVAAGEAPDLHSAHRDFMIDWLEAVPVEQRWLGDRDMFAEERAGVRATLQWSAGEGNFESVAVLASGVDWSRSADWHDGRRWCDTVLTGAVELPIALRSRLLVVRLVVSQLAAERRGFARARDVYAAIPATEPALRAVAGAWTGLQHTLDLDGGPGDVEVAEEVRAWIEQAVGVSEDSPPACRMYCRLLAAYTYLATGAYRSTLDERGEEHLRLGLAEGAVLDGYDGLRGGFHEYLALHTLVQGRADDALRLVHSGPATSMVPMLGTRPRSVEARALAALGRHDEAMEVLRAAIESMRTADLTRGDPIAVLTASGLAVLREDWEDAARLLGAGRTGATRTPDTAFFYFRDRALIQAHLPPERYRELRDEGIARGPAGLLQ